LRVKKIIAGVPVGNRKITGWVSFGDGMYAANRISRKRYSTQDAHMGTSNVKSLLKIGKI
jgi:hypothetical protein